MAEVKIPIWQDDDIYIGNEFEDRIEYSITTDGGDTIVFSGVAHRRPNDTYVVIRINEICANWLKQSYPFDDYSEPASDTLIGAPDLMREFEVVRTTTGEVLAAREYKYDWSYGKEQLSIPLYPSDRRVTEDMYFLFTDYEGAGDFLFYGYNASGQVAGAYTVSGDVGTVNGVLDLARFKAYTTRKTFSPSRVGYTQQKFHIIEGCSPYALYYVNAGGGWESLRIVAGNKAEALTRSTFKQKYHNANRINRGLTNYHNDIVEAWTLGTDWLTDEGSANMHHLIGSPFVILHDIKKGTLQSVVITDTSLEVKTFANQGRQVVRYDINVQLSQDRQRR